MALNISSTNPEIHVEENFQKKKFSIITKRTVNKNDMQDQNKAHINFGGLFKFRTELMWFNIIYAIISHIGMLYGFLTFNWLENIRTTFWIFIMGIIHLLGITAGAHRLWSHRSYKAKWPLKIILSIMYCTAGQYNLYDWVRDHRVHHKYTDTDMDPHNSNRGFFFCHIGWLMMKELPDVTEKGRQIDMSDILEDPITAFLCKYFSILKLVFCFLMPVMVPVYGWNETWSRAIISQWFIRSLTTFHINMCINSVNHMWGSKPYDTYINPTDIAFFSFLTLGEGWHNYHHVFPWDYKTGEIGKCNVTKLFIDMFAKINWAYDLKEPSEELVRAVAMKKGDGSHFLWQSVPHPDKNFINTHIYN